MIPKPQLCRRAGSESVSIFSPVTLTQPIENKKIRKQKLFHDPEAQPCAKVSESASIFCSRCWGWESEVTSKVVTQEREREGLGLLRARSKGASQGGREAYAMVVHKEQGANGGGGEQPKNSPQKSLPRAGYFLRHQPCNPARPPSLLSFSC